MSEKQYPISHGTHVIQWGDETFVWYDEAGLQGGVTYSLTQANAELRMHSEWLDGKNPPVPLTSTDHTLKRIETLLEKMISTSEDQSKQRIDALLKCLVPPDKVQSPVESWGVDQFQVIPDDKIEVKRSEANDYFASMAKLGLPRNHRLPEVIELILQGRRVYVTNAGENLGGIAARELGSVDRWDEIAQLNWSGHYYDSPNDKFPPGTAILLPPKEVEGDEASS